MPLISRYVLWNCLKFYGLVLLLISLLLVFQLIYDLVPMLESLDLKLDQVLYLITLNIPPMVSSAAPWAFPIAVFFCLRDLSTQNETVAMQSLGITYQKALSPILGLAVVLSGVLLAFVFNINPNLKWHLLYEKYNLSQRFRKLSLNPQTVNVLGANVLYFSSQKGPSYKDLFLIPISSGLEQTVLYTKAAELKPGFGMGKVALDLGPGELWYMAPRKSQHVTFANAKIEIHRADPLMESVVTYTSDELNKLAKNDLQVLVDLPVAWMSFENLQVLSAVTDPKYSKDRLIAVLEIFSRLLDCLRLIPFGLMAFAIGVQNPRFPKKTGAFFLIVMLIAYFQIYNLIKQSVRANDYTPGLVFIPIVLFTLLAYALYSLTKRNKNLL